jgi:methionyl-tRNA synthetase
LRFYLTAVAPETRDTEFSLEEFVERNNPVRSDSEGNELVATWGNLGQRPRKTFGFMLSFACKRFDGHVPEPGKLDAEDKALLAKVEAGFDTIGDLYKACMSRARSREGYRRITLGVDHPGRKPLDP